MTSINSNPVVTKDVVGGVGEIETKGDDKVSIKQQPFSFEAKPKLSKAERRALQEKQRAEKAARTAGSKPLPTQPKQQQQVPPQQQPPPQQQQQLHPPQQQQPPQPPLQQKPVQSTLAKATTEGDKNKSHQPQQRTSVTSLVAHLPPYQDPSKPGHGSSLVIGATIRPAAGSVALHPAVIHTGYLYATRRVVGGNSRCRAMLHCYMRLIRDFQPSLGASSSATNEDVRHVIENALLKPAFQYWTEHCRPHSVTMGNAYTFLKSATTALERDTNWTDLQETLLQTLQAYERERIDYAGLAIAEIASTKILFSQQPRPQPQHLPTCQQPPQSPQKPDLNFNTTNRNKNRNQVFLVYGDSEAVRAVLKYAAAHAEKTSTHPNSSHHRPPSSSASISPYPSCTSSSFRVIVVDSHPFYEGRNMIRYVRENLQLTCTYCLLPAITYVLKDVTKVLLGASSLLSDGSVLGRIGTAVVAMAANHRHIPVLVCSETYKISNRVLTESLTSNELGNPDDILPPPIKSSPTVTTATTNTSNDQTSSNSTSTLLLQDNHPKGLNLLYDLTPADFVSGIITELGIVPPTSIAVLLREMNPIMEL